MKKVLIFTLILGMSIRSLWADETVSRAEYEALLQRLERLERLEIDATTGASPKSEPKDTTTNDPDRKKTGGVPHDSWRIRRSRLYTQFL